MRKSTFIDERAFLCTFVSWEKSNIIAISWKSFQIPFLAKNTSLKRILKEYFLQIGDIFNIMIISIRLLYFFITSISGKMFLTFSIRRFVKVPSVNMIKGKFQFCY